MLNVQLSGPLNLRTAIQNPEEHSIVPSWRTIIILITALLACAGAPATAQQLGRRTLSSSGATSAGNFRLSWTLGQIETKRLAAPGAPFHITQGFQQRDLWKGSLGTLSIQSCAAAPGARVTSDIVLTRPSAETDFGPTFIRVTLAFNASLLYAESLTDQASVIRWDYNEALDSSVIELQVRVPDQRAERQVLTTITFVAGLGNDSTTALDLVSATPGGPNIGLTLVDGTFTLLGICREGGPRLVDVSAVPPLLEVNPNPVTTSARIRYRVDADGHTIIRLFTLDGRLVGQFLDANIPAGDYEAALPLQDLSNGRYLLQMQTGPRVITASMVVAR